MKKIKTIVCIILSFVLILLPIATPMVIAASIPSQYDNTFVGALVHKVERLGSIEGEKVVIIGGSSVAFGIDSALIEKTVNMPVVNFGLYAAIGTRAMLELSRSHIGKGDTVIIAPEMDPQTLSMYFSSDMMLKAIDSNYSIAHRLSADSKLALLGGLWNHVTEKLEASRGEKADPEGVYNSKNFNEYGDVEWERAENVMPFYYDPNTRISLTPDIVDAEFIDYLNEYTRYCERRGARVCFTYAPMNERALADGAAEDSVYEFEEYLDSVLDCEIVSFASTYIMDAGYFYDTNYHLNDTGVTYRTRRLVEDVFLINMDDGPVAPALPDFDPVYDGEEDANAAYFTYEELPNGALSVTGLTELGMSADILTVPLGHNGRKVIAIGESALLGSSATKLVVTSDTNLRSFLDGCMSGSAITDIWIYYSYTDEEEMLAPASDFGGVNIHIPPSSLYPNQYAWLDSSGGYEFILDAVE